MDIRMSELYEDTLEDMVISLKENNFFLSKSTEVWNNAYNNLFSIGDEKYELLQRVEHSSKRIIVKYCVELFVQLLRKYKIEIEEDNSKVVDFIINTGEKRIGYCVKMPGQRVDNGDYVKVDEIHRIILLEWNEFNHPNSKSSKGDSEKGIEIKDISVQEFFKYFPEKEYEEFKEMAEIFNAQARQIIGIDTTIIPSEKAIDEFRKNVLEKIETYEYEQKLIALFDTVELKIIRKRFNERYKVLVQNSDYARCFVSSEWYYDIQEKTNNGLEQTAVVAGYFKAVEQLLFEIIKLSMREQKITIEALRIKRKEDEKKYIPLITDNLNRVNKMLNSLINCINYPKNQLFVVDTKIKEKVICFITEYKNKNRNQYFHNDNLYSWEKIKEIREKTYEILFLILGCLKIDEDKIDLLGKGDIIFEEPVVEELTYQLFANWVEKLMRFNNLSDYNVIIFEFKKDGSSKNKYRLGVRTRDFYVDNGYGMKVEDPLSDLLPHYRTMLEWKSEKSIDDVEMKVKKIVEEYLKKGKNAGVLLERDVIAVGRWEHFECLHKK